MKNFRDKRLQTAAVAATFLWSILAWPQTRTIDVKRSTITVRAFKSGVFSLFAHDHTVAAPIERGEVQIGSSAEVELFVDSRRLKVLDPELAPDKRAEVQQTMHSPAVLDSARFPEIHFRSTAVRPLGNAHWLVQGELTLHGHTHPVSINVTEKDGGYRGNARFKQREFGITPVSIAGGTVKVKDELLIEFQVWLAPGNAAVRAGPEAMRRVPTD